MVDPLIESRAMVGEWDEEAGGWTARDWVAGPAGTVGLTLPGGVELDVDVASPQTFVGLWVDAAGGQASPEAVDVLRRLLGDDRAEQLVRTRTDRPQQLTATFDELSRQRRFASDPREPGVDRTLARHALALAQATEPGASELVVALATLDAAASATRVDGLGLEDRAAALARQALAVLADRWPDFGAADPGSVNDALRMIGPLIDDRALLRRLGEMRRDFEPVHPAEAGRRADTRDAAGSAAHETDETADSDGEVAGYAADLAVGAPMPAAVPADLARHRAAKAASPVSRLLPVDVRTLDAAYGVADAAGRRTTPSEAEVRLPGRSDLAERLWARAFAADGTPLAVSRFVTDAGDAIARLLVPPAQLDRAELDVVDDPSALRPSARLRATVEAIEHGRSAARADRLQDPKQAFVRWSRSADHWRDAGDDDRATTARRYAEGDDVGRRYIAPLLSDRDLG